MKSVKPGRGPSAMSTVGSLVSVVFGVFWTIIAFNMMKDSPFGVINIIFPLFGLIFIVLGIFKTIYHYKNATGKNRMSLIDITDNDEEPDPLNLRFGEKNNNTTSSSSFTSSPRKFTGEYCPYCGNKVEQDFDFCPKCGKDI